jgi:hypothetical protein
MRHPLFVVFRVSVLGLSDDQAHLTQPFGSQRSLPAVKGSGFFQAHFSAAVGELNNTKSVGFILEGDRTREVHRFLERTVPIKRLDFLAVAQENGLINHQTSLRPCMRVSG